MNKTQQVIAEMLTENTGMSFLDSGGYPKYDDNGKYIGSEHGYGRAYERNRGRDFENEKPLALRFDSRNGEVEIDITANLFHWLSDRLDYDEEVDKLFQEWANSEENNDKNWSELIEEFPYYLAQLRKVDKRDVRGGPYGEGGPSSFYTYNSENILSQDIIVSDFFVDSDAYVLLQIHNGCDARGGFTRPRVFQPNEPESMYGFSDASIGCKNGHRWSTDDSYHWYADFGESWDKPETDEEYAKRQADEKESAELVDTFLKIASAIEYNGEEQVLRLVYPELGRYQWVIDHAIKFDSDMPLARAIRNTVSDWTKDHTTERKTFHQYQSAPSLKDYRAITDEEAADDEEYQKVLAIVAEAKSIENGQTFMEGFPKPEPKIGLLRIDDDGNGYCPICGGVLEGWI